MSVLIIDDEAEILRSLKRHCDLEGISCVTSQSPVEALRLHAQSLFPVVLTDIMMPEMNGIELVRAIKSIHPTCIVYVMTGYSALSRLVECLEAGAADYFTKPFDDMDEVVAGIGDGIERHRRWKADLLRTKRKTGT